MFVIHFPLRFLMALNTWMMRAFAQVAWVLVAYMVLTILVQVFFRYALNSALPWPEEAARAFMIWMMALVAAQAYRNNAFVAIEMLHDFLPKYFAKSLKFVLLIVAGVVLFKLWQLGLKYFDRGFRTKAASINWLVVSYYIEITLCFLAFMLVDWWRRTSTPEFNWQRFVWPTVAALVVFGLFEYVKYVVDFAETAQFQTLTRAWIYLAMPVCFGSMFLVNIELVLKLIAGEPNTPDQAISEDV